MKPITSKKRRRGACDRRSTDPACWRSSRGLPATGWTVADAQKDCWRSCNSNRGWAHPTTRSAKPRRRPSQPPRACASCFASPTSGSRRDSAKPSGGRSRSGSRPHFARTTAGPTFVKRPKTRSRRWRRSTPRCGGLSRACASGSVRRRPASSRAGLGPEIEELILPSPFDFYHQALVCLPTDMPLPEDESFDAAVEQLIASVARRAGGRTLALFTSHRQLRDVHAGLKQRVDLDEVLILGQGIDGQRRQLLKTFEEAERPLLLGTARFWEGIGIPGERLSCVIVVRLPFPVPTDPVYAARAEQLREPC